MRVQLCWDPKTTPAELRTMLKTLGEEYPITQEGAQGVNVAFERIADPGQCCVEMSGQTALVRYNKPCQAARAVGALLGGLVKKGQIYSESTPFGMLGVMIDCSRNAVMTVDHLKIWMRRLALLGYNMLMLYTEDTYELPEEPYFGYQRGAYTKAEIKAVDAYAAKLNIETIPCIQTLGHLERILRHRAYGVVRDTPSVMLVGEQKTYDLIEKMIRHWTDCCRTKRIHIGMDETHNLRRGRYLDLNKYRHGFELFNEHLGKVVEICHRYERKPMIWSDMYFRLGAPSGSYYDLNSVIPPRVVNKIPKDVELVYWDYYHNNVAFYLDWIARHRKMGKEPLMGSGIWTWSRYWYDHRITEANAGACIDACYEAKLNEVFFTQWGDNGAYCDHDSAFAGMVWCADKSYGKKTPDAAVLEKRFGAVCGGSYAAHILAGEIHGAIEGFHPDLWDDPIFETHFRTFCQNDPRRMAKIASGFETLAKKIQKHANDRATGDLLYASRLIRAMADRLTFAAQLLSSYRKKDKTVLRKMLRTVPKLIATFEQLEGSFRDMWLSHNKPEGLETIQARFGMIQARYRELGRRLKEYLEGKVGCISELDCSCPPK